MRASHRPGYHFQNGERAFVAHDHKLTTRSAHPQLVAALVTNMESNGATAIGVSGTKAFRQRAWRAAVSAGLSVDGYEPTKFEVAKYMQRPAALPLSAQAPPSNGTERAQARAVSPRSARDTLIRGELLAHGATSSASTGRLGRSSS
ncbi:MAG: LPD7 domain-containing protein [Gammaproteobacteria bacterium]